MALSYTFTKTIQSDPSIFYINNTTVYGGSNPLRNAGGEVLIVAKVDSESAETFLTVDSTPYDSKLTYTISNSLDGYYHAELLRFNNYNSANSYVIEVKDINNVITTYASLVYYPATGKFYKAIVASSSGAPQIPTNSAYWEEITNFTTDSIRKNTTIEVGIFDLLHDLRNSTVVKDSLYDIVKKELAANTIKDLLPYLKKAIYLEGARVKSADSKFLEAEIITRVLDNSTV